jgi:hypothetical protein
LKFDKSINPQRISRGLLTGLVIANCIFCRWGVTFSVKQVASSTAWIDLKEFKGDVVYAQHCAKELGELLPSCYSMRIIEDWVLLIRFDDDLKTIGKNYE